MNEIIRFLCLTVLKTNSSVRFLEESEDTKKFFRNYLSLRWGIPLPSASLTKFWLVKLILWNRSLETGVAEVEELTQGLNNTLWRHKNLELPNKRSAWDRSCSGREVDARAFLHNTLFSTFPIGILSEKLQDIGLELGCI